MRLEEHRFTWSLLKPRYWLTWLGIACWWLLVQLPYACQLRLGVMLGWLMKRVARRRCAIIRRNIELCFPELSPRRQESLYQANVTSTAIAFFETGMAWFWPQKRLAKIYQLRGIEHLYRARQEGRGVILLTMHFTTLELGAAFVGINQPLDGMYRPHQNLVYDFIQKKGRWSYDPSGKLIARNDVRTMIRSLREGRMVWYAPDQDYGAKNSVFVPFFNREAATVKATAQLAKVGNAVVLPFTQTRLANGQGYELRFHPYFDDFPTEDEHRDALRVNRFIEARIREQPEQYLWAHRRFKTRPPGSERVYPASPSRNQRKQGKFFSRRATDRGPKNLA